MKAILKYPGAKWNMAEWIQNFFPKHHSYVEPFFGSGAVLFNKPRSNIETVNDMDGEVVNFFRWAKTDPEKLAYELHWTPYARQVYDQAYAPALQGSIEQAVNFCIRLNMGYGYRTTGEKVGWKKDVQGRERAYAARDWAQLPELIFQAAERLRGVQIENRPALDVIRQFNCENVLFYCDPPYLFDTRYGKQYKHEMNDPMHEEFLDTLLKHKGMVLLSGYDSGLYNSMLKGWTKVTREAYTQRNSKRTECLWMNFDPPGKQFTFSDIAKAQ